MVKTMTQRMLTKQRLFGLRMLEGTSFEVHISKFKEVIWDLGAMDANTLIEDDLCSLLLMSLLASYTAFRDTLFYGHKNLSLRMVYESLLSKEIMNHMGNGPVTQAEGLFIRGCDLEKKKVALKADQSPRIVRRPATIARKRGILRLSATICRIRARELEAKSKVN